MRAKLFILLLACLVCAACAASVKPVASPTGTINPDDGSITEERAGVAFTVRLDQLSVAGYQSVDNVIAFHVLIDNRTDRPVSFPPKAFLLKDGSGLQSRSVPPERVREIVSKDTVYLIPYPYVGYYYLPDQQRMAHVQEFSSSLPFYAEYHPQNIFTQALTEESILAHAKAAGLVYFLADPQPSGRAEVTVYPGGIATGEPLASFAFTIEK